ncbi:uncharacterized protein BDW43DRAFT_238190 [Aspergillus alliaceus]|uniref:uncharacterized protein n=1 Tax=Petromyces alliaceus TaxID=209559 RepID=UPI0012A51ABA|nr:uncharacterized protein BDW43DRAFT_238190 [Aspergillus alliaceus]KAB8227773.1 hypothetical protein BDW43DRAFT_238190 [Aspergillus alliaceus]
MVYKRSNTYSPAFRSQRNAFLPLSIHPRGCRASKYTKGAEWQKKLMCITHKDDFLQWCSFPLFEDHASSLQPTSIFR